MASVKKLLKGLETDILERLYYMAENSSRKDVRRYAIETAYQIGLMSGLLVMSLPELDDTPNFDELLEKMRGEIPSDISEGVENVEDEVQGE